MGSLGFKDSSASGEFKGHIKYDARAGRMFRADKIVGANGFEKQDVDITRTAMFVADIANIRVGWINYTAQGPIKALGPVGSDIPCPPDVDAGGKPLFKQGFELDILLHKSCSGVEAEKVREFSSTAAIVRSEMERVYDLYSAAPEAKAGKLPVLRLDPDVPSMPVTTGSGARQSTNYQPRFLIIGWVDRPPLLAAPVAAAPQQQAFPTINGNSHPKHPVPPVTGAQRVAAPSSPPPPPAAALSVDDFG